MMGIRTMEQAQAVVDRRYRKDAKRFPLLDAMGGVSKMDPAGIIEGDREREAYWEQVEAGTIATAIRLRAAVEFVVGAEEADRLAGQLAGYPDSIEYVADFWRTQFRRLSGWTRPTSSKTWIPSLWDRQPRMENAKHEEGGQ